MHMATVLVPGLLLDGTWVPPLRVYGAGGVSLTNIIITQRDNIFPNHHTVAFDLTLRQDLEDPVKVDLALVSKDFRSWCLVFVFPVKSVNPSDVRDVVEKAQHHIHGARESDELRRQISTIDPTIDTEQAQRVVTEAPQLLVVTDDPRHGWADDLQDLGMTIMVVEPFLKGDQYVIRINGEYPTQNGKNIIARCNPAPFMENVLSLEGDLPNAFISEGPTDLIYGGVVTNWNIVRESANWFMMPMEIFPINESPPWEILVDTDGNLSIRAIVEET